MSNQEKNAASSAKKTGRKVKKNISSAVLHVKATFNNTIVTLTDVQGNALAASSGGAVGFKGSRKSTPYAGQLAVEAILRTAVKDFSIRDLSVRLSGIGASRENAVRAAASSGVRVTEIRDVNRPPIGGCKPSKRRRI